MTKDEERLSSLLGDDEELLTSMIQSAKPKPPGSSNYSSSGRRSSTLGKSSLHFSKPVNAPLKNYVADCRLLNDSIAAAMPVNKKSAGVMRTRMMLADENFSEIDWDDTSNILDLEDYQG